MNNRLLELSNGDLLELADARGTTLRVGRGTLWVTQQDDTRDVVLATGDTWTVQAPGRTVVEARGSAKVLLIGSGHVDASVRSRRIRWQDRVTAWRRKFASGFERAADRHLRRAWVPHV